MLSTYCIKQVAHSLRPYIRTLYLLVRGLQPRSFMKVVYTEKLVEVSWLPPENEDEVTNYTVFWCKSENSRDRPYQVSHKEVSPRKPN